MQNAHPGTVNETASTDDFEFAALQEARNYRAALCAEFESALTGKVLEVGAGVGQMSQAFRRLPGIAELVCVEPDPRFHGGFAMNNPDIRLIRGLVADVPERTGWNAIVSVNVLEHVEHDAEELMQWASMLRGQRGRACIFVPARPEIYAPIDRDFGHFRRYTKADLRAKLVQAGFQIERLVYFNITGYLAWWLNFCIRKQRSFDPAAVRFYDRVVFPVVHWMESHAVRPPIGQSLLAIARA